MKTKNACFWIFLLLSGSAYAQMSQKGTVQIFNSNKSPLPGVQLQQTKTGNGYRFSECI